MTDQEILKRACELKGHRWERSGLVLTGVPPQYQERCVCCEMIRYAIPQEPFRYRYHDNDAAAKEMADEKQRRRRLLSNG